MVGAAVGAAAVRPAPDRRGQLRRVPARGDEPARQPGAEHPLHDRRSGARAAGRAHAGRRRPLPRPPAGLLGLVRARARLDGRDAGHAGRRQGHHDGRDPVGRPGPVRRADVARARAARRRRGRRAARADRAGPGRAAPAATRPSSRSGRWCRRRCRPPTSWPGRGSRSRSSTCARCGPGTADRSSRSVRRTGRLVTAHEAWVEGGVGAEVVADGRRAGARGPAGRAPPGRRRAGAGPERRPARPRAARRRGRSRAAVRAVDARRDRLRAAGRAGRGRAPGSPASSPTRSIPREAEELHRAGGISAGRRSTALRARARAAGVYGPQLAGRAGRARARLARHRARARGGRREPARAAGAQLRRAGRGQHAPARADRAAGAGRALPAAAGRGARSAPASR